MDKFSKIYVAGHNGLVGSAILKRLKEKGYMNFVTRTNMELDLRRQAEVEYFFNIEKPKFVFLAAAKVGGIFANNTYKAEFIYDNIMIALNVINSAYKYGVNKLLNLGSSCIYPKFAPQPMKEESLLTGILEPTNEPYAIAKISAIKLCRYYNEQYGTNFISVMPTNLYGHGDNFNLETSHVLPALIRKIHLAKCLEIGDFTAIIKDLKKYPIKGFEEDKLSNEEIINLLSKFGIFIHSHISTSTHLQNISVEIWGTGEPYREFLYVDDLANACVFLMENRDFKDIGEIVNIGTGEDIKIKDLVILIKDIIGFNGQIVYNSTKPDGTPKKLLDVSRINSLGWEPTVSLRDGIQKVYEWYIK
ncbi:MAG: GDP-L-fucose synthase [Candidatus Firestonebacteria bacterium]|nr:GDP-L-fucose synthase [Candidatus Firestonebacteria bacterium]